MIFGVVWNVCVIFFTGKFFPPPVFPPGVYPISFSYLKGMLVSHHQDQHHPRPPLSLSLLLSLSILSYNCHIT